MNNNSTYITTDTLAYLASGPGGIGQNFASRTGVAGATLTGNSRRPFTTELISLTCTGQPGSLDVYVLETINLSAGMMVKGQGIAPGAVIAPGGVSNDSNIITLSDPNVGSVCGLLTFQSEPDASTYVAPIALGSGVYIDAYTTIFTFAVPAATIPFRLGSTVRVQGATLNLSFNKNYNGPGVVDCTLTQVTVKSIQQGFNATTSSGGTMTQSVMQRYSGGTIPNQISWTNTDVAARSLISGSNDKVILNALIAAQVTVLAAAATDLQITYSLNRSVANNADVTTNDTYRFTFQESLIYRVYNYSGATQLAPGTTVLPETEINFGSFLDTPQPGYYAYSLQINFRVTNSTGDAEVTSVVLGNRSMTAQVLKT